MQVAVAAFISLVLLCQSAVLAIVVASDGPDCLSDEACECERSAGDDRRLRQLPRSTPLRTLLRPYASNVSSCAGAFFLKVGDGLRKLEGQLLCPTTRDHLALDVG